MICFKRIVITFVTFVVLPFVSGCIFYLPFF